MKNPESTFKLRSSVEKLVFSPTLAINERVGHIRKQSHQILHMGFGQSPFPVYPTIQEALRTNADKNMYLPSAGLQELRSLARNYFSEKFGFYTAEFDAIIGPGSKELVFDVQLAVEGDLLLPVPSWVSYAPQASLTNDQLIKIHTSIAENHHITADSLEKAIVAARLEGRNPKKLIINYPNNPSGLTISADRLEQIARVCKKYNILVISDEIYGLVNYQHNHVSIARYYPEGTIVTTGLSKHLSLGGYRLGVALVPVGLRTVFEAMICIASETWSAVSAPVQFAALKAFQEDPNLEEYIQTCTRIHCIISEYVRQTIVALDVHYPELHGAFYLYPSFDNFREKLNKRAVRSSEQLAGDLLDRFQIATLPGTAFGDDPEHLTLRLATCDFDGQAALNYYRDHPDCTSVSFVHACCPNIKLGCRRLTEYFDSLT
jgi:aspartate/methionine/tyrosine aminotransferase